MTDTTIDTAAIEREAVANATKAANQRAADIIAIGDMFPAATRKPPRPCGPARAWTPSAPRCWNTPPPCPSPPPPPRLA